MSLPRRPQVRIVTAQTSRIGFGVALITLLTTLCAHLAWAQGNSGAAHWCAANFPPGQRGQCVSQAAHGAGPYYACGPGGTNTGLCGGVGGKCCTVAEICIANACAPFDRLVSRELGIAVKHPPGWIVQRKLGAVTVSNVAAPAPPSDTSLASESFFQVGLLANTNPDLLPIDQWFDQHFSGGFAVPPLSRTAVSTAGHPAVRIEASEIGRWVHVYISRGADVIVVDFGPLSPSFVAVYEAMLQSIVFTP